MPSRPLSVVNASIGATTVVALVSALRQALAGEGPALVPVDPTEQGEPASTAIPESGRSGRTVRLGLELQHTIRPDLPVDNGEVAVIVPTSGSTGEPKGVELTASALWHSARATHARLGGPGQWLLALPPSRIAGLLVLVRALDAETEPVVLEGGFTPAAFAAATERLGSSGRYTALVPTQLVRILDAGGPAVAALASYDAVLVGGGALPESAHERAADAGVALVTTYGMTETCGGCVYDGYPLTEVRVHIDQTGRILLGGPVLFAGYRRRPDLTQQALSGDWHVTSDLGQLHDDGRLEVRGRADDVAISGGVNVPLQAVERAVADLEEVTTAAAVGVPDPEWGERIVVYVVPRDPGTAPLLARVREHVANHHPRSYAPGQVIAVQRLPMLPSAKPDRLTLRSWAAGSRPDPADGHPPPSPT